MYIVLVSSTGRKGPLAQGIEAQILGLYMAHFLGLVSLIVCVRVCVYGICVLVRTGVAWLCRDSVCVRGVYVCIMGITKQCVCVYIPCANPSRSFRF